MVASDCSKNICGCAVSQAAYLDSGKCMSGQREYIVLLFRGKELDDEKTLAEQHVGNGSVLIHLKVY